MRVSPRFGPRTLWLTLLLSTGCTENAAPSENTSAMTLPALKQASNAFYSALADVLAGDAKAMNELWSHAEDVSYMGPMDDQLLVGWSTINQTWQDQAAAKIGGQVVTEDLNFVVGQDLGVVVNYEVGSGHVGVPSPMRIRVTSAYRLEDGQVKMISHHTDRF